MKLFLVTRADLSPGQQAVQAAHAMREFAHHHPELDREWYTRSNILAFLSVPDERALERLMERADQKGFSFAPFHEPDRDNELTAVAFGPECHRILASLPLALRCMDAA